MWLEMRRINKIKVIYEIESFGWSYIDGNYKNKKSILTMMCPNRHILQKSLSRLMQENGHCYVCKRNKNCLLKLDVANNIAESNGGRCLSDIYAGNNGKCKWKCSKGHIWDAVYSSVVNNKTWCPMCANNKYKSISDAYRVAEHNGGKCLSEKYVNVKSPLIWKCKCGFIWSSSLDSVKNGGTWCPKCNKGNYIDIDFVKKYVSSKNGICLSEEYKGGYSKMTFICEKGHKWNTTFRSIYNNKTWCPICAKSINKSQVKLYNIIKEIFDKKKVVYNYKEFDWLKTSKYGKQEIDIWVPHIKLAIEYDGEQHFKPMRFGSKDEMQKKLKIIQSRDKIKNKKILENKNDVKYFIRISYKEKLTKSNITNILTRQGVI